MITRFSQPTSLIMWLSARTPTILEHERIHSPSKLVSDIKEIKTIKDETENLHVVLLSKKRFHSVSGRCKQSCIARISYSKELNRKPYFETNKAFQNDPLSSRAKRILRPHALSSDVFDTFLC